MALHGKASSPGSTRRLRAVWRRVRTLDTGLLALRGALGLGHADQALLDDAALISLYLPQRLALRHLLNRCPQSTRESVSAPSFMSHNRLLVQAVCRLALAAGTLDAALRL
jgi:hypothetical protein